MATMAPALTEAASEAHQRLRLPAPSPSSSTTAAAVPAAVGHPEEEGEEARRRLLPPPSWRKVEALDSSGAAGKAQRLNGGAALLRLSQSLLRGRKRSGGGPALNRDPLPTGPDSAAALLLLSSRQELLDSRVRRLRRRLEAVQAKHVQRHVEQQLAGLVERLSGDGETPPPPFSRGQREVQELVRSATARLRAAEAACDSDVTESSSGGEEAEESDAEPDPAPQEEEEAEGGERGSLAPGCRRAEWQWAVERAAIICRWTWLQAQVSDLEYRIRQQTDIYRQIRANKGSVVLGRARQNEEATKQQRQLAESSATVNCKGGRTPSSSSSSSSKVLSGDNRCDMSSCCPSRLLCSVDKKCSHLMQSLGNLMCQSRSSNPVSESPVPLKSCTPARQINGLSNRLHSALPNTSSVDSLDIEQVFCKRRRLEGLVAAAAPYPRDASNVAARIRPLNTHNKPKLIRASAVSSLSRKPQKPLTMACGCEEPSTCILCKASVRSIDPSTMSLAERIALLDPSFHPILSFPHDIPLHLHFEMLLKEDPRFRLTHTLRALRLSQLRKKPQDRTKNFCQDIGASPYDTSPFQGMTNCSLLDPSLQAPKPPSAMHPLSSLFPEISPFLASNQLAISAGPTLPPRRKKTDSSFDINNIVIPMSMAAATRVEKLQYKEILTPSWRVVDAKEMESSEHVDMEIEDISDEGYLSRHAEYEILERSHWDSWSAVTSQRRISRSCNKGEGRWTLQQHSANQGFLQPASPDVRFHSLNDLPPTPSTAGRDSPELYSSLQCISKDKSRANFWNEDTRSSTPEIPDEEVQTVQPWEPRIFPLSDEEFRILLDQSAPSSEGGYKQSPNVLWHSNSKQGTGVENTDFGLSIENFAITSKEAHGFNIARSHSSNGDLTSLEYIPVKLVNKR
ncbi:KAT8 regulatory NSL complex subunit 1-like isoform X2 [Rhinatrema bivittatum]|uniref:KAT8 regulatory NSL complex subunit 1-like isoform X2 n=1 Tax=Rhinatrema bivittatum TaxID=194408 RepID=UPI00112B6120|nr:KAT8 regulatory NSL complex subunit 1-like isoform X2 [Rhinatrema bivittatum]